jgi:hypothetical protein
MQAPTAPGSASADPGLRVCPQCNAVNGPANAFCWQCYRQFNGSMSVPAAPASAVAPGAPGRDGVVFEPRSVVTPAVETTGWNAGSVIAVIAATALLVAGVTLFLNRAPAVELPERFGGLAQASGPQIDVVLDEFHRQVDGLGVDGDMGLYGNEAFPTVALVWVKDPTVASTDAAWEAFAEGFNQGLPAGSLDEGRRTSELVGGITYLCAPVDAAPPSNICLWEEDRVFWILVDLSGASQRGTRDLAVTAHDAIAA